MADSQYVVEVEVEGFLTSDAVDSEGKKLTPAAINKANKAKLNAFDKTVTVVDSLVRDDGTGILHFQWDPPREDEWDDDPTGAVTWQSAKEYTEHIISSVVGAQFQIVEERIVLREPS